MICLLFVFALVAPSWAAQTVVLETTDGRLEDFLKRDQFDQLEKEFERLRAGDATDKEGYLLASRAYERLAQNLALMDHLNRWCHRSPRSHTAYMTRGLAYFHWAWSYRGSGYSDSVSQEQAQAFQEMMGRAQADLEKAYDLDSRYPQAPTLMIRVATGRGLPEQDMELWYERAMKAFPGYGSACFARMNHLLPKWHGTAEKALAAARECAARKGPKSNRALAVPAVHKELALLSGKPEEYYQRPGIWEEVVKTFTDHLKDFPNDLGARNEYALAAVQAKKHDMARRQLEKVGSHGSPSVWGSYEAFESVKAQLQSTALFKGQVTAWQACNRLIDLYSRKSKDQGVYQMIDLALNSPNFKERAAAASGVLAALEIPESPEGLAASRRLIGSRQPWCRYWGYQFLSYLDLAQIRDATSKTDLVAGLKDGDESARKSVVQALGAFSDRDLIPILYKAFREDPSLPVRERAACSLSKSGVYTRDQRWLMIPFFVGVMRDHKMDDQTKNWAVQALSHITGQGFGRDVGLWEQWWRKTPTPP